MLRRQVCIAEHHLVRLPNSQLHELLQTGAGHDVPAGQGVPKINNQAAGSFSTITGGNGNTTSGDWLANPGSDLESRADVLEMGIQGWAVIVTPGQSC